MGALRGLRSSWAPSLAAALALAALVAGCDDDVVQQPTVRPGEAPPPPPPKPAAAAAAPARDAGADAGGEPAGLPPLPVRAFQESDFAESEQNRDPFRSYESLFAAEAKGKTSVQRPVLAERYSLDELKLVGLVTRGAPSALLTDSTGYGWVAKVGDLIGKPEIVQAGGPAGGDVAINWRVDRIRDGDVVFVREDPSHPQIPPATRVIALYPVEDEASSRSAPRRR
jgi:type IV pilus assembly protein PilP